MAVPSIPQSTAAAPTIQAVREEFSALKGALGITDWSLTQPTEPDKVIQLRVTVPATEAIAQIFGKAHSP